MHETLEARLMLHAMLGGLGLTVTGTEGNDQITLSLGDGMIVVRHFVNGAAHGPAQSFTLGDAFNLHINALGGNDVIRISSAIILPEAITIDAGEGDDLVLGSGGRDVMLGQGGNDRLYGQGGDNRLVGGAGRDVLVGGSGDDVVIGGEGDDLLLGGQGFDLLYGGDGRDRLYGGGADDTLRGEGGDDLLYGGAGDDFFSGGAHDRGDYASSGGGADRDDGTVERSDILAARPMRRVST